MKLFIEKSFSLLKIDMVTYHHCGVDDNRGADRHTRDDEINRLVCGRGDRKHGGVVAEGDDESVGIKTDDERGCVFLVSRKCKACVERKHAHSEGQNAVKQIDRRKDRKLHEHFLGLRSARKIGKCAENIYRRRKPQRNVNKEFIPPHRQLAQIASDRAVGGSFVIVKRVVVHWVSP